MTEPISNQPPAPNRTPMVTVLLATRNRAPILRRVMEAYCHLKVPSGGWKLVVVDNGSVDETNEVLASFSGRLPLFCLHEPTLGKNFALNAGLSLVEGDLAVLTDDDAFPAADWLLELCRAADEHRDFVMFGGMVLPRWEIPPPHWIGWVSLAPVFTVSDPALQDGPVDAHHVFGPNMAVRASLFQKGTRFDVNIGPRGAKYAMGSETELLLRLERQGHKAWFVRAAVVEHYIRKSQLEISWVIARGVRLGRGQYRLYGPQRNANARFCFGVPLHLLRRACKQALLVGLWFVARGKEPLFQARWRLSVLLGQIREARTLRGEERVKSGPAKYLMGSSLPEK